MNKRLTAAALVAAAVIGAGGWFGYQALGDGDTPAAVQTLPDEAVDGGEVIGDVETVQAGEAQALDSGSTPMRERVAVLGLLNKRNGVARDVTIKPGQVVRLGDTVVRLRACERTAPWEPEELTGAFVQFDVREADQRWRRAFSGWLYKERPGLNVVQHPVYDVWVKSCATAFPQSGPDTVTLEGGTAPGGSASRSSARKSPAPAPDSASDRPSAPDNAAPSNSI
jgi:hypothetical protein